MTLTCAYCDRPGDLARDHVVPRSRGGPDDATNLVLACRFCNSAKADRLPSEWLGERCPPRVLLVEARVNAKLKAVFARRDRKTEGPARVFAFHTRPNGDVDFVGEVVSESPATVRINCVDAMALWAGIWDLTGALEDVPRSECRLFADRESCVLAAERAIALAARRSRP